MSLLPDVERELLRVARPAPGVAPAAGVAPVRRSRARSGGALALAVALVALLIGAGFLLALRGPGDRGASSGAPPPAAPAPGSGPFPGAPRSQPGDGLRCREVPPTRYLPRRSGCLTVLRIPVAGRDRVDLVMLYAALGRRSGSGYLPGPYALELARPSGAISRLRLPPADAPPAIVRAGNVNGVSGDELTTRLDLISSGDTYGLITFTRGRLVLVRPLLSAGGDSVEKEGFACESLGDGHTLTSQVVTLLGPGLDGRWRWTVTTYAWHGARLRRDARRSFVRRGFPRAAAVPGGLCGRRVGRARG